MAWSGTGGGVAAAGGEEGDRRVAVEAVALKRHRHGRVEIASRSIEGLSSVTPPGSWGARVCGGDCDWVVPSRGIGVEGRGGDELAGAGRDRAATEAEKWGSRGEENEREGACVRVFFLLLT